MVANITQIKNGIIRNVGVSAKIKKRHVSKTYYI